MNSVNIFFFAAGALATVALLFVLYPWLAGKPRSALLAALPRWVPLAGVVAIVAVLAFYIKLGSPQLNDQDAAPARAVAQVSEIPMAASNSSAAGAAVQQKAASSMDSAVTGLERRLAAGGGSDGDWELLAKSYEFLGRPGDAALARQKHLPAGAGAAAAGPAAAAAKPVAAALTAVATNGVSVRGEVVVADSLKGKIPAGLTLFIVAKSVHSPGPPVAIWRTTTGAWPLAFQLDDTQAMLPSRTLSTAGVVTIEARTSRTGQAMPASGDFQGVTAQFDPAAGKPVRVVIQKVIG